MIFIAKNSKERKRLQSVYNYLYSIEYFGEPDTCAYCGDYRDSLDHVPALSVVHDVGVELLNKFGIDLIKVPVCRQCNSALSNRKLNSIEERLLFLFEYYSSQLRRITAWEDEEINELSGNLKMYVMSSKRNSNKLAVKLAKVIENLADSNKNSR